MALGGFADISNVSGSNQEVIAAVAGKRIRVWRLTYTLDAAGIIRFTNGDDAASTRFHYAKYAAAGAAIVEGIKGDNGQARPVVTLDVNTALKVTASAGNVYGTVEYDTVTSA